jgi:hypothetical protein
VARHSRQVEGAKRLRGDITADRAYLVLPVNYTFKQKGKPANEVGSIITLTLKKGPAGWRITG